MTTYYSRVYILCISSFLFLIPSLGLSQYFEQELVKLAPFNENSNNSLWIFAKHPTFAVGKLLMVRHTANNKKTLVKIIENTPLSSKSNENSLSLTLSDKGREILGIEEKNTTFPAEISYLMEEEELDQEDLLYALDTTKASSQKMEIYNKLCVAYRKWNRKKAIQYGQKALRLAQQTRDKTREAMAHLFLARAYAEIYKFPVNHLIADEIGFIHTVKEGENIYDLADYYACTPVDIRHWNKLGEYGYIESEDELIIKPNRYSENKEIRNLTYALNGQGRDENKLQAYDYKIAETHYQHWLNLRL